MSQAAAVPRTGSFAGDASVTFIANFMVLVGGIVTQSLLAWYLLPEGRGEFAACRIFGSLLFLGFALGQEMANLYYVGSGKLSVSEAMTQSLVFGVACSVVAVVVGWLLTVYYPAYFAVAQMSDFRLSLAYVPIAIVRSYLAQLALARGDTRSYALLFSCTTIVFALCLVVGAVVRLTVTSAIVMWIASEALGLVLALWVILRRYGARLVRLAWAPMLHSLHYGIRFYGGRLCSMVNLQLGAMTIALFVQDAAQLGMFTAASAMFSRIWVLAEALNIALLPRSAADPEGRATMIAQVVRICLALCAVGTLLIFLLSRPIIALLLSPAFLPVLVPAWLLLPGYLLRVISKILPAYFAGTNRPQITSLAIGISMAVNVGLIYLLLPPYGLHGVALAMTLAYVVEAVIMVAAFKLYARLPVSSVLFVRRKDWRLVREKTGAYWRRIRGAVPASP